MNKIEDFHSLDVFENGCPQDLSVKDAINLIGSAYQYSTKITSDLQNVQRILNYYKYQNRKKCLKLKPK